MPTGGVKPSGFIFMKDKELIELEHKYRMEEIEAKKKAEIEALTFRYENELKVLRIRTAEIKRSQERRLIR